MLALALLLAAAPLDGLDKALPGLDATYRALHQAPELSKQEKKTAALLAERLKALGFTVTTAVGGFGVVGVLQNGKGKTVLVRADLDALPVEEKTGLPYASTQKALDADGKSVSVMHACGHDMHMAVWLGTATLLAQSKGTWSGTLVFVGQPAEELGDGAKAMLKAGLLERFPKPDAAVALHNHAGLASGTVGLVPGYALANVDSLEVTFFGKGGHGAYPQTTVDPVVLASKFVVSVQTLVAREQSPLEPTVVTVGSIHGGTRGNIIPEQVVLQLSLRSYTDAARAALVEGVERIAKAEALAARAPKAPEVKVEQGPSAVLNDPALTARLSAALVAGLGQAAVVPAERVMGAEDFGEFSRAGKFPSVMLWLGSVEPSRLEALKAKGESGPSLHSGLFAPDRERSLRTGVSALTLSTLELLR
jgi:amidohydrolase